jgi:hypothetical protein
MRIRRVRSTDAIESTLAGSENDVLPIVFADEERLWIERTISPHVARLGIDAEDFQSTLAVVYGDLDNLVLGPQSGPLAGLSRRYASITGRRAVNCDFASLESQLPASPPYSLAWFCSLDELDLAESLQALRTTYIQRYGRPARIGILTAEDLTKLSLLLARQLVPNAQLRENRTTVVANTDSNLLPLSFAVWLGPQTSSDALLHALGDARGTLIIQGHSRPHCGRLLLQDGEFGVCGLHSGGADGRCVDGVVCHFSGRPRFSAQETIAARVYYDGCSTGKVGGRRLGPFGLPREAMLSHAMLRSGAREYIGKLHASAFDEADPYWLLGLSSLGYTPAECVPIMDAACAPVGRECFVSRVYFGDPTNHCWPSSDTSLGEVIVQGDSLRLRWQTSQGLLVAKLPGQKWWDLAEHDLLDIRVEHDSNPQIRLAPDLWGDSSIVLVLPSAQPVQDSTLEVELCPLQNPMPRDAGQQLLSALEQIRWLGSLPSFRLSLHGSADEMENELIAIRRTVTDREDRTLLPKFVKFTDRIEMMAAYRFDALIMDQALIRARTRWEFLEDYGGRSLAEYLPRPSLCSNCGSTALSTTLSDLARANVVRVVTTCSSCGIVGDLPSWPLEITLDAVSLRWVGRALEGSIHVRNRGTEPRIVTLGASLVGAGEIEESSRERFRATLDPESLCRFDFFVTHRKLSSGTMRFRVFAASRGAFGFVGGILLVPPASIQDRH